MPRKAAPKPEMRLAIGAEVRQLLTLMAEKAGVSPAAVLESAVREKAQREQVTLPAQPTGNGIGIPPAAGVSTPIDLRPLAARVAAGDAAAAAEMKQILAELRATATVTPAKPPEELDPGWQDRFVELVEQVRRGVPEEWTEEELQEQIAQAIAEVRVSRAGDH